VLVVGADLTDPASVAAMMAQVKETFGTLDLLVLNASGGMESGMGRTTRSSSTATRS
jgi:NAD(P)-dependent dehydrogenase (short-subunit alcohol dehydrogenase family)